MTTHAAICECGWHVGPWRGRLAGWLIDRLFERHVRRCRLR